MNRHIGVAVCVLLSCTSSGPQGPEGPQGPQGQPGAMGTPGQPGTSVSATTLDAGDARCPHGGTAFISPSGTTYACHGAPGAPGQSGGGVAVQPLDAGDASCPSGGTAIISATGAVTRACNGAPGAPGPAPSVAVGGGLQGDGSAIAPLAIAFAGAGVANTASRSDHTHVIGASDVTFNYAGSASQGGAATSAVTALGLTCASCVQLAALAFDPATQAELDAALFDRVSKSGDTMTGWLTVPAVNFGPASNDHLDAPMVQTLTGGANADELHTHGPTAPLCPHALINGVCVAGVLPPRGFVSAATSCAALGADLCSDSQSWVLRRTGMLDNGPSWSSSFSDNDGNAFNEALGAVSDDHAATTAYLAPCCLNVTPVRSTDQYFAGVRVVHLHNAADTYFRVAAAFCAGMNADLCGKSQYEALRQAGAVSVPVWSSDHSDNDDTNVAKGVGLVGDNPTLNDTYGFACCTTRSSTDCPVARTSGVCMVSVSNAGASWSTAANDCANQGARLCSMSETAVLRANGAVTSAASWTDSYSDNDSNFASVAVGTSADNHAPSSVYGYACCL